MEEQKWKSMIENPNRVKILEFFAGDPTCQITTQDLSDRLGIPESTLSVNLNELLEMGVLDSKKGGKYKYYWMDEDLAADIKQSLTMMKAAYTKLISKKK